MDREDIIDGLGVISRKRGENVTLGDIIIVVAAINALKALRPEGGLSSLPEANELAAMIRDAKRYRFLQRTTCGNTAGGKGSDEECYLSLNPRDMDAAIDSNLEYQSREPQRSE